MCKGGFCEPALGRSFYCLIRLISAGYAEHEPSIPHRSRDAAFFGYPPDRFSITVNNLSLRVFGLLQQTFGNEFFPHFYNAIKSGLIALVVWQQPRFSILINDV